MAPRYRALAAAMMLWSAAGAAWAAASIYTVPPLTPEQRKNVVLRLEMRWEAIQKKAAGMGVRELFTFALESAEADYKMERIAPALALAEQMQDRDPNSPTYGNFKWRWGDKGPDDRNAVEFSMQDASLLWMRHRDRLDSAARERLERLITLSIEGIRRHRVAVSYTNIFLMKIWNCIALGENTNRPDLAQEGYGMLDAWMLYTWENGIHEYLSPTYYAVDLDSLALIAKLSQNARARKQAEIALRYFWTEIAANWFAPCERLGGAHSRDYDYLTGHGNLDTYVAHGYAARGWAPKPDGLPVRFALLGSWLPPADLRELATGCIPRMVRQRWGSGSGDRAAHYVGREISIASAGATYGNMDKPLTIQFARGGPQMPMVNFFMDARNDPFGNKKEVTGGGHLKALHVAPFLMSVQREREVLMLASASPEDAGFTRNAPNPVGLFSQLVLPRSAGVSIWIGDEETNLAREKGQRRVQLNQPVFLRYGNAAAGFRILHAVDVNGKEAAISLNNDGNNLDAMTLTVMHCAAKPEKGRASVAFWVRAAENLDEAEFAKFRREFAQAEAKVQFDGEQLDVAARGGQGLLRLAGNLQTGERLACEGAEAGANDALLAIDGREVGRAILREAEPVRDLVRVQESLATLPETVRSAAQLEKPFEVENALLVLAPFAVAEDAAASGGRFVWVPGEPGGQSSPPSPGRMLIPVRIPDAGTYYLHGRVQSPTPADDSFYVQIRSAGRQILPQTEWPVGVHRRWSWTPFTNNTKSTKPMGIALPAGVALVEILSREDGTRLDQILLSANPALPQ
ncbi:MAG: hypothetical protein N3D11_10755 [Candidatus Sumerlaeia bacterium]|nr:hypothetical protein [Candidatus Sumerlaeia bacterium]